MKKDEVIQAIHDGLTDIVFEKVDGTLREIQVTLSQEYLPPVDPEAAPKKAKTPNPDVQNVYLPEQGHWRSFRWDKLRTVNGVEYVNDN